MEEQLVSFETAKLAKEKGFNLNVFFFYEVSTEVRPTDENIPEYNVDNGDKYEGWLNYNDNEYSISAPTQSLLQKWLREKQNIVVEVQYLFQSKEFMFKIFVNDNEPLNSFTLLGGLIKGSFKTYEDALEKGLQEALKLINDYEKEI